VNKERRARIADVQKAISDGQFPDVEEIRSIAADEREAFEALSENLQGGEKGQRMTEIADALDEAADELEQAREKAEQALEDAAS